MDKKEKKKKREREEEGEMNRRERGRNKKGPWVFVGAKGKVGPRIESYTWVPKSWSFIKLQEVGNFPTLIVSRVKVI